ncbi:MAG: bifunctional methylenetetrahydrofolate dehydrogenase/methenyltetrahydrofolate cyclohydrolase FolD [Actinobacteria bacterium]|nr:bifunctional methylenetetrahydrofolate dehydrogenase/methenyltetrahydrofolate cyclohydrolase FolD [Actinomycetota bacterium]
MGLSNVYGVPGVGTRGRAKLIDGKAIAAAERQAVAAGVERFVATHGRAPALATILVGDDPASAVYVSSKVKACAEVGLGSVHHHLPADVSREAVLALIDELNADSAVSGILCQLPVPDHLDGIELTNRIDPGKDVDGLTVASAGRLALGLPGLRPCTPAGVMAMLAHTGVEVAGRRAAVLGRSNLFGKPMAQMLTAADATVTLCHSRTLDLSACCREADVLIAAVGRPAMVKGSWIKPGATVIDVGINRGPSGLVGDVDFAAALPVAGAISPVPGGVGPMTIACLLRNTLRAAELAAQGSSDTSY